MDPSLLLMLSDLLHLQNHLDPTTTSLLSDSQSSNAYSHSSSSAAPLLFFTIASVIAYASSTLNHHHNSRRRQSRSSSSSSSSFPHSHPPSSKRSTVATNSNTSKFNSSNDYSVSGFKSLSNRIWTMDSHARDAQWRSSYGLSYPVFASLLDHLKPHLLRPDLGLDLPPDYALAVVLSRLSCAHPRSVLARRHSLSPFLISKLTNLVTRLLATKLYPEFVTIPAGQRLLQAVSSFRDVVSLPNVCGAIHGSPIRLSRLPSSDPSIDPSAFCSRRLQGGCPSILLQAVSDQRHIFWDVCVKAPGAVENASHFRDSLLYRRLISSEILRDSVVVIRGQSVRPYLIGDASYPLLPFLMTPFFSSPGGSEAPVQNSFDAALARGLTVVEHAVSLLKGRWRILQNLNVGLNHAPQTIVACCVLHNICQIAGEPEPELFKDPIENSAAQLPPVRPSDSEEPLYFHGERLRQGLAEDLQERQQRLLSR